MIIADLIGPPEGVVEGDAIIWGGGDEYPSF